MGPGARGWAARSSSEAGLLPSAQLQHPAGEERGREARMEGRGEGEEGGWAGREPEPLGSAHAPRGRAQPLARLGPRCRFFPQRGRVSHGPAPPGGPAPARSPRLRAHGAGVSVELRGSLGDLGTFLDWRGSVAWAPSTSRSPAARVILSCALGDCWKPEACV